MTTPRFFTDPLSGADFPFKGQLTSAAASQILAGLRGLDYALEWNQAVQWPVSVTMTSLLGKAVTFSRATMQAMVMLQHTGAATVNVRKYTPAGSFYGTGTVTTPAGGWTTTTYGIAVSSPTVTIVGGATVNASAQKIAVFDAAAETFALSSTANAAAGVGPACGCWDAANGLFIIGINGSGTGKIETSPNGVTWTPRTAPAATTPSAIANNGSGVSVMLLSGAGTTAWRSTNGTSWSAVTLPASASWSAVAYSAGSGLWVASDGSANIATSSNGTTWSAATLGGAGASYPAKLASTRNIILGLASTGIAVSENGATYRRATYESPTVVVNDLWASDDIALAITNDTTDGRLRMSPTFRI